MTEFGKRVLESCKRGGGIALVGNIFKLEEVCLFYIELKDFIKKNNHIYKSKVQCDSLNLWWSHLVNCRVYKPDSLVLKELFTIVFEPIVTLVEEESEVKRPTLGLKPRQIHNERRLDDIKAALIRYGENGLEIPIEWIEEYNDLIKKTK